GAASAAVVVVGGLGALAAVVVDPVAVLVRGVAGRHASAAGAGVGAAGGDADGAAGAAVVVVGSFGALAAVGVDPVAVLMRAVASGRARAGDAGFASTGGCADGAAGAAVVVVGGPGALAAVVVVAVAVLAGAVADGRARAGDTGVGAAGGD